jgi:hypothetical protein
MTKTSLRCLRIANLVAGFEKKYLDARADGFTGEEFFRRYLAWKGALIEAEEAEMAEFAAMLRESEGAEAQMILPIESAAAPVAMMA